MAGLERLESRVIQRGRRRKVRISARSRRRRMLPALDALFSCAKLTHLSAVLSRSRILMVRGPMETSPAPRRMCPTCPRRLI